MNFPGKFEQNSSLAHFSIRADADSFTHEGVDAVIIPDGHLPFSGDYARSGVDLIISDHLHRVVVPNYLHGDKRPTLVSPEGALLDSAVIEALTGHVAYARGGADRGEVTSNELSGLWPFPRLWDRSSRETILNNGSTLCSGWP